MPISISACGAGLTTGENAGVVVSRPQLDRIVPLNNPLYLRRMYSKQEAAQRKREFWTAFGQYMAPLPSATGDPVSWVNYKTGEKGIAFRLDADNREGSIAIELSHTDAGLRQLYVEQLVQLRPLFEEAAGTGWDWVPAHTDDWGKTVSRIGRQLPGVSVYNKEDWPALIAFFKTHLLALDAFWADARWAFEALR